MKRINSQSPKALALAVLLLGGCATDKMSQTSITADSYVCLERRLSKRVGEMDSRECVSETGKAVSREEYMKIPLGKWKAVTCNPFPAWCQNTTYCHEAVYFPKCEGE